MVRYDTARSRSFLLTLKTVATGIDPRRVKGAAKVAGLGEGFGAHSPRVSMAQDLRAAGAELPELMIAEKWQSPAMPARYTEAQTAGRVAVARYYREGCRK